MLENNIIIAGGGHAGVEIERFLPFRDHIGIPLPDRHPVEPLAGPGMEMILVCLLPVAVGELDALGVVGDFRKIRTQRNPDIPRSLGIFKESIEV